MTDALRWPSRSPSQTTQAGQVLGSVLRGGDVVALSGPLGSGKTQFVKGIAAGLAVPDSEPVVSPTFVLIRVYAGRLRLYHIDAYRLTSAAELFALGWEELLADPQAAVALEWPERAPEALPERCWRLLFGHAGPRTRRIEICGPDSIRQAELATRLAELRPAPARARPAQP